MKVFQTNLLLDKIIVFGSQGSNKIFNSNTRVGFPLTFQLFQLFVGGTDIESVENSPVEVKTDINRLIVDSVIFCYFPGSTRLGLNIVQISGISGREVQCRQVTRISQRCVVFADLLFVMDDT